MRPVRCPLSRPNLSLCISVRSRQLCDLPLSSSSSSSSSRCTAWRKHAPAKAFATAAATSAARYDGPPPDFAGNDGVDVAVEGSIQGFDQLNPWPRTQEEDDEGEAEQHQPPDSVKTIQPPARSELGPEYDEMAKAVVQRFERLIAYRLALQMLLQLQLGGRSRYRDVYEVSSTAGSGGGEEAYNGRKIATIMQRLQQVTADLEGMRDVPVRRLQWGLERARGTPPLAEVVRLNNQLYHLMEQYRRRGLSVAGLVDRFATIVMESGATPDNRTYTQLIQLFGQVNREDLLYLVLAALHDSALALDVYTVHAVLWSYASTRDTRLFDAFLAELTRTNGRVVAPWEWRRINGTLVAVPAAFSSVTTLRLVAVALSCDQPERAEAWATLMAEERPLSVRRLTMMKNFLRYYTYHQDWRRGRRWLAEIVAFAAQWARVRPPRANAARADDEARLAILRMLHLAHACGKAAVYEAVLAAAVAAAIAPPRLPLQFYSRSARHVHHEWDARISASTSGTSASASSTSASAPFGERIVAFAAALAPLARDLASADEDDSSSPSSSPFVFTAASTAKAQQARIDGLEAELARARHAMLDAAARYERQIDRLSVQVDALTTSIKSG